MRYIIGLLSAIFIAIAPAHAQQKPVKSGIRADRPTVDFGIIAEENGPVSATFDFTNGGNEAYVIDQVTTTCGCTVPSFSKTPVGQGERGSISVTFDPTGRPGEFEKQIYVSANNRKYLDTLTIKGAVTPRPRTVEELFPVELTDGLRANSMTVLFGMISRNQYCYGTIGLANTSDRPVNVAVKFLNDAPHKDVHASPTLLLPGGEGEIVVEYDFSGTDIWGIASDPFEITINGRKWRTPFSANATVIEDFSALTAKQMENAPAARLSSSYYHFGNVRPGSVLTRSFELANTGGSDLIIRHIQPTSNAIRYTVSKTTLKKGEKARITATLSTGSDTGHITDSLMLILNCPSTPVLEFKLAATVQE